MTTQPRSSGKLGVRRWLRGLAVAGTLTFVGVGAQPPKPAATTPASDYDKRVVAYIYGNVPITRQDLGEYLIDRGGMYDINRVVNKRIVEIESARRKISVTQTEILSALAEDLRISGAGMTAEQFETQVLPRYGVTMYEWAEDIIHPRLILSKMVRDRISVSEAELRQAFEFRFGEQREARVIVYPKGHEAPESFRNKALTDAAEFDRLASTQPDPKLAAVAGRVALRRNPADPDPILLDTLFAMKVGDTSAWLRTKSEALVCIKFMGIIQPDPKNTFEKYRVEIESDLIEKKLNAELPKQLDALRAEANPHLTQHVPTLAPSATPTPRMNVDDPTVLAVIYGNVKVTREDLGEFLIARHGTERLELLINKRIIETEAARRGIVMTQQDLDAGIDEELKSYGVGSNGLVLTRKDFEEKILPSRNKTTFEWIEDDTKPKLMMARMFRDRVKLTEEDLQHEFEHRYGEKRQAKLIVWPKDQFRLAQKQWTEARASDADFDRIARAQPDPNLAANCGLTKPMGRYSDAENHTVEKILFQLQLNELSQLFETPAGIMCMKCVAIIPPAGNVKLDQIRPVLEKDVFDKKLTREIPNFFAELKKLASPNQLLKGAPSLKDLQEGTRQIADMLPPVPIDLKPQTPPQPKK